MCRCCTTKVTIILERCDFQPVTLANRDLFRAHYAKYPQVHSDNTFTNMVCWNHYAHYEYAYVDGSIILASTIGGKTRYRPPIGPRNRDLFQAVLDLAIETGDDELPVNVIDTETKAWLAREFPDLRPVPDQDHFEYVYLSRDLAGLSGGNYLTIRRQLNRFRKNCSYRVEPVTPDIEKDLNDFLKKWCEWKGCDTDPVLANEKDAIYFAVKHFAEIGLSGLVIRVDDVIASMALFEGMNPTTALVHFEKGLPDCEGIYKAINAETASLLEKNYLYINRESDLGVPGLREAKQRYHPHHMIEIYSLLRSTLPALS